MTHNIHNIWTRTDDFITRFREKKETMLYIFDYTEGEATYSYAVISDNQEDAETAFLQVAQPEDGIVCIRIYEPTMGTVITADGSELVVVQQDEP